MIKNPDDIPENSPLKNLDIEKINKEIENLDESKLPILERIEKILGEQTSS